MRVIYVFLWIYFKYTFRLFYRKIKLVHDSPFRFGRTIFVSNHPGSFMDPLLIASQRKPILFFMTRADVFNKFSRPFFWAAHMLPIFRQRDGVDTKVKNSQIFIKTNRILQKNRNILIFGEGFTDDKHQRRLHPLKKGAMRIGFSALEFDDWNHKIMVQGLGINYTDFNLRGSDVLISSGAPICLNDYKEAYELNPAKVINELTRKLELDMQSIITDVRDFEWSDFHEDLMMFTRKGLHPLCFDQNLSIESRWNYSKKLATWLNKVSDEDKIGLSQLKTQISLFKDLLNEKEITENERFKQETQTWNVGVSFLKLVCLFPFMIIGFFHAGLAYFIIKYWVEKNFKRPVFWGSTKKMLAIVVVGLINLPICFIFPHFLPFDCLSNYVFTFMYYSSIGIFAFLALKFKSIVIDLKRYFILKSLNVAELNERHSKIMVTINNTLKGL